MGEKRYILFLDDRPERAALFSNRLSGEDRARTIWARTATEAIEALLELGDYSFDSIHLDHDLGGVQYQDSRSEESGMEVVRWMEKNGTPSKNTKIIIHSWNLPASRRMVERLTDAGYKVQQVPFGMGK